LNVHRINNENQIHLKQNLKNIISIKEKESLNMSKNACIIDNECDLVYKQLVQSTLSKCANIPMIVIQTYKPSNDINTQLPKVSNGIKIFTRSKITMKQLEVHRGMTVNALFARREWLYVRTVNGDEGYVPIDCCCTVGRREYVDEIMFKQDKHDATNVSLFDISQKFDECMADESENISELEFSMYEPTESANYVRSYKIKNYLQSLESLDSVSSASSTLSSNLKHLSVALDSGYSDTDSVTNFLYSKQLSKSAELLNLKTRRGIKTNGSICSISPNPSIAEQSKQEEKPQQINVHQTKRFNLSTIIEQSYNTSTSVSKIISNESVIEAQRNQQHQNVSMSSISEHCENESSVLVKPDESVALAVNMLMIVKEYDAVFIEDLSVQRGEVVTILDDTNPEWLYVISLNGKGYVPRSSVCL
jgi:hypothetical protein